MKKITDDKFLKKQGWRKVKGYKIDLELLRDLPDNWSCVYTQELSEYVKECDYWTDGDEGAYEGK